MCIKSSQSLFTSCDIYMDMVCSMDFGFHQPRVELLKLFFVWIGNTGIWNMKHEVF